jgi:hypothetical protein
MFTELPHEVKETIAYKLNVCDRTKLNCVLPKNERFKQTYDKSLGVLHKAICRKKLIQKMNTTMRDFLHTISNKDETLNEIKNEIPDMFKKEIVELDEKDRIFSIIKQCDIKTYQNLRINALYNDVFKDDEKLTILLHEMVWCNPVLLEYIFNNEKETYATAIIKYIQRNFKYSLYNTRSCKIILEHSNFSKEYLEELYIKCIENLYIDTAEVIERHLNNV